MKAGLVFGWLVAVLAVWKPAGFILLAALALLALIAARIPPVRVWRTLWPVLPFIPLTLVFASLSATGGEWLGLSVTDRLVGGLLLGARYSVRLVLLVLGSSWLTWTTSPVQLTAGLLTVLQPTARFGFPAGDLALLLSATFRLIPVFFDEAVRVKRALAGRGLRLNEGPFARRLQVLGLMMIPLFMGVLDKGDSLAWAFEIRGWRERPPSPAGRLTWVEWCYTWSIILILAVTIRFGR